MKRSYSTTDNPEPSQNKKLKGLLIEEEETEVEMESGFLRLDEDLLFEVLKHVDAKSLAIASCVNKQWHRTAQDERLWEMVCTRHWPNIGCGNQQLRSVVLALGGFKKLYSLCLWPLQKLPPSSQSLTPFSVIPSASAIAAPTRWGKDEVHLSLSLLSIRYYEKMNLNTHHRLLTPAVVLQKPENLLLEDSTTQSN